MINRLLLRMLREEINAALKEVASRHKLVIEAGGATFDPNGTHAKFSLELKTIGEDGTVASREGESFKQYASAFGLSPDDLGKRFEHSQRNGRKETFEITGLNTKAVKYPVNARQIATGKMYRFPVWAVQKALGRPTTDSMVFGANDAR